MLMAKLVGQMTASGMLVKLSVRNQGTLAATNVKATVTIASGYEFTLFRAGASDSCTYTASSNTIVCTSPSSPLKMKDSFRFRFLVSGMFETTGKVAWKLSAKADNADESTTSLMIR